MNEEPKKPDNIILEGLCGSRAYGLDTEDSDEDWKGIFVVPTESLLGLKKYKPRITYNHVDPDWIYHEVGKFAKLAMGGNPTLTELLWLDGYRILTKHGKMLVDNRHHFLSTSYIRNAYSGYVFSQARKLNARDGSYGGGKNNRYEKHSRHLFRLLYQGRELLETGKLTVRVTPEVREELFSLQNLPVNDLITRFEKEIRELDNIKSVLPDKPNYEKINEMLLRIRKGN